MQLMFLIKSIEHRQGGNKTMFGYCLHDLWIRVHMYIFTIKHKRPNTKSVTSPKLKVSLVNQRLNLFVKIWHNTPASFPDAHIGY